MINRHDPSVSLDEALAGGLLVGGTPPLPLGTKLLRELCDGRRVILDTRGVKTVEVDLGNGVVITRTFGEPMIRIIGPPVPLNSPGQWSTQGGGGGASRQGTKGKPEERKHPLCLPHERTAIGTAVAGGGITLTSNPRWWGGIVRQRHDDAMTIRGAKFVEKNAPKSEKEQEKSKKKGKKQRHHQNGNGGPPNGNGRR